MGQQYRHYVVQVMPRMQGIEEITVQRMSAEQADAKRRWYDEMQANRRDNIQFNAAHAVKRLDPQSTLNPQQQAALDHHAELERNHAAISGPESTHLVEAQSVKVGDIITADKLKEITRQPPEAGKEPKWIAKLRKERPDLKVGYSDRPLGPPPSLR